MKKNIIELTYVDTVQGEGEAVVKGDTITVHYEGRLEDGTIFDSSIAKEKPFTFSIGEGKVIRGWEDGIIGMQVGGKRTLTIPPELAYGDADLGLIPPNSTLIFDVELLNIE